MSLDVFSQLQMKPDHIRIDKVKTLINKGKPEKALKKLHSYFPDFKDNPDLFYLNGLIYQEMDSIDLAIENYLISLVIFEHHNDALFNLGAIHYNKAVDLIKTNKEGAQIKKELQLAQTYLERLIKTEMDHLTLQYLHQIYKMTNQAESRLDSILQNQFIYAYLADNENSEMEWYPSDSTYTINIDNHVKSAEFPGGNTAMYQFIGYNIVYPIASKYKMSQGTVYAGFIVETDGSISSIQILKGVDDDIDREVIKVIDKMPKWIPALNSKGKAVRCGVQIPIKFTLK